MNYGRLSYYSIEILPVVDLHGYHANFYEEIITNFINECIELGTKGNNNS